tara:strand:- start:1049 stop:1333 length:285 start_codon:yes stop_codon:yes gene_type:complete
MRKVQFKIDNVAEVNISEISDSSNIGVLWSGGNKTLVVRDSTGAFRGLGDDSFSLMSAWSRDSKAEYCANAAGQGGAKVFEFETKKECLTWFAK